MDPETLSTPAQPALRIVEIGDEYVPWTLTESAAHGGATNTVTLPWMSWSAV